MHYKTLGRTGLSVSVAGLGCGGHSRLGQTYGNTVEQSIAVVHAALDLGINWIDTAAAYGTEKIVGQAVKDRRDRIMLSTKTAILPWGQPSAKPYSGVEVLEQLEKNLSRLGTDYIDLYNLHGIVHEQLPYVNSEIVPALIKARKQGKIRFLGITEHFGADSNHWGRAAAGPAGAGGGGRGGGGRRGPAARRN